MYYYVEIGLESIIQVKSQLKEKHASKNVGKKKNYAQNNLYPPTLLKNKRLPLLQQKGDISDLTREAEDSHLHTFCSSKSIGLLILMTADDSLMI